MNDRRRSDDQLIRPMFYAGLFCFAVAAALALIIVLKGGTFTTAIALLIGFFTLIGGLMMPTQRVVSAIRFWRRSNGDESKP